METFTYRILGLGLLALSKPYVDSMLDASVVFTSTWTISGPPMLRF